MKLPQHYSYADQLMRQTRMHHVALSSLADTKANMLITISAIVVPLTLHFVGDPILRWPAIIMIFFNALTVLLAAYAAMPKIRLTTPRDPSWSNPSFNPLFFGDFVCLDYQQYLSEMETVFSDPEHAYETMCRDVYLQGQYLAHRKYKFLRYGYCTFILGLVCGGAAWILAAIWHSMAR